MDFSRLITDTPCQDVRKNDVNVILARCIPPDSWEKTSQTITHMCEMFNATGVPIDRPTR